MLKETRSFLRTCCGIYSGRYLSSFSITNVANYDLQARFTNICPIRHRAVQLQVDVDAAAFDSKWLD